MLSAPVSRLLSRYRRSNERGQVLPFFAVVLLLVVLLAGLIIDGALVFQSQRDVETIAFHAARAGANQIVASCRVAPGTSCPLDSAKARSAAISYANTWLAQSDLNFSLPVKTQQVTANASGTTVTVSIIRCYSLQIPLPTVTSPNCPGRWEVRSTQTAHGLAGN